MKNAFWIVFTVACVAAMYCLIMISEGAWKSWSDVWR